MGYARASAAEACNVGDRLDLDIAGPKALGMRAVWVSTDVVPPDFATPPDGTIPSLEQLPGVLERWLP